VGCSLNNLEDDGLYLIDNGFLLILYIKYNMNSTLINSLFGVNALEEINFQATEENVFADPDALKQRIINIVDYIRR
jgi:hypothetical protein